MSDIIYNSSEDSVWSKDDIRAMSLAANVAINNYNYYSDRAISRHIIISKNDLSEFTLADLEAGYGLIYNTLLKSNPQKEEEWQLLLRLNNNNYKTTVFQIEDYLSKLEK